MKNQCQHLTETQGNELLKWLQKSEYFSDRTLVTWKKYPADFELKKDTEPICSKKYTVPKVHEYFKNKDFERLVLLGLLEIAND